MFNIATDLLERPCTILVTNAILSLSAFEIVLRQSQRSKIVALRCLHYVELLTMHVLDLHLSCLSCSQVLSHQAATLHGCRIRHGHRVVWTVRWPPRDAWLQVQNESECRVAVEVVSMQSLRADEAQIFVDA